MKKYKFLSCLIALASVLCLGLTACGEMPGAENTPTVEPTPTAAQTPAVEPTPAVETTPAATSEPTPAVQPTPPQGEWYTLNANGRRLTLALEAEKLPEQDFYRVDAIKVYDGGQLLSTTDTAALEYEGDYLFDGVFFLRGEGRFWDPIVQDFNFDGCDDLCLMATNGSPKNMPFAYFLWNEAQQRLDFSFVLSNRLTVDTENRCLIESIIGPAGSYEQYNTYRFDEQGNLVLQPVFMVENHVPTEYRVTEDWSPLTAEQKDMFTRIPAGELPKEAVAWGDTVARKDIWEDTLVPLVYNAEYDVTLYGVIGAEELWGRTVIMPQELRSDGLVLRVGDRAQYYPLGWGGNHWYGGEPTLELLDTDSDGQKDSAAVIPWSGRGVGVHTEVLYRIDLNDLSYQTVDFSQLNVQVRYDPTAKTATLTCGDSSVTVDASAKEEVTRCTAIGQVHFRVEDGQIRCSVGLDFGGAVCYWAWANGVIEFTDAGPCFANIVMSDVAVVQNG